MFAVANMTASPRPDKTIAALPRLRCHIAAAAGVDFHKVKVIFVDEDANSTSSVQVCLVVSRLSL